MAQEQTGWNEVVETNETMNFGENLQSHQGKQDKEEDTKDNQSYPEPEAAGDQGAQTDFAGDIAPKDSPHDPVFRERLSEDDEESLEAEEEPEATEQS